MLTSNENPTVENGKVERLPHSAKFARVIGIGVAVAGALALCSWQTPALAHHSFAAYDQAVTKSISGTLKEFDWNAPHSGITVAYVDEKGEAQEVSVTTGAPSTIANQGFKPRDFKVGAKITLSWHPNRNGLPGGEMTEVRLEDGRVLHGGFGPPGASPGPPGAPPPGAPAQGIAPPTSATPPGSPATPPVATPSTSKPSGAPPK